MMGTVGLLVLEVSALWCVAAGRSSGEPLWELAILGGLAVVQGLAGGVGRMLPGTRQGMLSFVAWCGLAFGSFVAAPAFLAPSVLHTGCAVLGCGVALVAGLLLDRTAGVRLPGGSACGLEGAPARVLVLIACLGCALLVAAVVAPPLYGVCDRAHDELDAAWRARMWRRGLGTAPARKVEGGVGEEVGPRGPVVLANHAIGFGPLPKLSNEPEVFLRALEGGALTSFVGRCYVRLMTYNAFVGRAWTTVGSRPALVSDGADGLADGWTTVARGGRGRVVGYSIVAAPATGGILPTLPGLESIRLPGVLVHSCGGVASPVVVNAPWVRFSAKSVPREWSSEVGAGRVPCDAGATDTWMEDNSVSARIEAEAFRLVPEGRADRRAVDRLLGYFGASFRYSRSPPEDESGHPLELFLFKHKEGHCELFATGLALMLRSLGIPARFSVGYVGGRLEPGTGARVFCADDAHAWVEVYTEGAGWVVVDPTPANEAGSARGARVAERKAVGIPAGAVDLADYVGRTQAGGLAQARSGRRGAAFGLLGVAPALVLALLGLVALALAGLLLGERRGKGGARRREVRRSGVEFFDLYCEACARKGVARKRGETPLEYLSRLKGAGLAGAEQDRAFEYLCDVCYGVRPRDLVLEKRFRVVRPR